MAISASFLCIDIGNTLSKVAVFEDFKIINLITYANETELTNNINTVVEQYNVKHAILSTVKNDNSILLTFLQKSINYFIVLDNKTLLPIKNQYQTPTSLGNDRIAVAVAAHHLYPKQPTLSIVAGTCITYNFVNNNGEFLGGGISPGLQMRFKALHTFTAKLPLITQLNTTQLIGTNTQNSIKSGVINGAIAEIEGIIDNYYQQYTNLKVLLTGGNAIFLETQLKNRIFADTNLVLQGLNLILQYHVSKNH